MGILDWIEAHPGLAGYLQVFGSLVAVWIAYRAPRIAAAHARQETAVERRRATLVTIHGMTSTVRDLDTRARKVRVEIEQHKMTPTELEWNDFFDKYVFVLLPPQLQFIEQWTDTDEDLLAQHRSLAAAVRQFNAVRFEMKTEGWSAAAHDWPTRQKLLLNALDGVQRGARSILATNFPMP